MGDLFLLDEEYTEAIFHYQCCIEQLLKKEIDNDDAHYPSHILSLIRTMLKMGLTHEKRKTYNSAYITYNELMSKLIHFRFIDQEKLGLSYRQEFIQGLSWRDREDILYTNHSYLDHLPNKFDQKVYPKISHIDTLSYEVKGEEMLPMLNRQLTPDKNAMIVRLSMFEDIRLIYQALLAKLFVLEKKGLSGITLENIDMLESDFLYLHRSVYYKDKFMISADFFRKLADILYYKNGLINHKTNDFYMTLYLWDYNIENDIHDYCSVYGYQIFHQIKQTLQNQSPYYPYLSPLETVSYHVLVPDDECIRNFLYSDHFKFRSKFNCKIFRGLTVIIPAG
ncbi:MAG: hypothetical protein LIP05_01260 [Tannerellaceae bacterium]|nr:hypothetical protein [Tannerellaceae bacterium]